MKKIITALTLVLIATFHLTFAEDETSLPLTDNKNIEIIDFIIYEDEIIIEEGELYQETETFPWLFGIKLTFFPHKVNNYVSIYKNYVSAELVGNSTFNDKHAIKALKGLILEKGSPHKYGYVGSVSHFLYKPTNTEYYEINFILNVDNQLYDTKKLDFFSETYDNSPTATMPFYLTLKKEEGKFVIQTSIHLYEILEYQGTSNYRTTHEDLKADLPSYTLSTRDNEGKRIYTTISNTPIPARMQKSIQKKEGE